MKKIIEQIYLSINMLQKYGCTYKGKALCDKCVFWCKDNIISEWSIVNNLKYPLVSCYLKDKYKIKDVHNFAVKSMKIKKIDLILE